MNPLAFEMNVHYLVTLANAVYSNRYFEFVQSDDYIPKQEVIPYMTKERLAEQQQRPLSARGTEDSKTHGEDSKLLSIFDELRKSRQRFTNLAYNSEKFKDLVPRDLSMGNRKKGLVLDPRLLTYWEEYFGQFDGPMLDEAQASTSTG